VSIFKINVEDKPMSNEQKDPQSEKTPNQTGVWLAIGAGVGILLGIIFHNIAVGVTFGAALGLVFGAAFSLKNNK
jgi:uncharacterized membrane protein